MGADIHGYLEMQADDGAWEMVRGAFGTDIPDYPGPADEILGLWHRHYGMFAWLADVRNYAAIPPLALPRGLPTDASTATLAHYESNRDDWHDPTWFTLAELHAADYDTTVENRRVSGRTGPNRIDGGLMAAPGDGISTTLREFLGTSHYFERLALATEYAHAHAPGGDLNRARIVMWFDN